MGRLPSFKDIQSEIPTFGEQNQDLMVSEDPVFHNGQKIMLCACCHNKKGKYGQGLLCKECVRIHVGTTYLNLSDMIKYYS